MIMVIEEKPVTSRPWRDFKKVKHSKYERNDPNVKKYWKDYFDKFDRDFEKKRKEIPNDLIISTSEKYEAVAVKFGLPMLPVQYRDTPSAETIINIDPKNLPNSLYSDSPNKSNYDLSLPPTFAWMFEDLTKGTFDTERNVSYESSEYRRTISGDSSEYDKRYSIESSEARRTGSILKDLKFVTKDTKAISKTVSLLEVFEKFECNMITETEIKEDESEFNDLYVCVDDEDMKERMFELERMKRSVIKSRKKNLTEKQSQYLEFLQSPEKKVARWRGSIGSLVDDVNELPLPERAAYIEDLVASEFCNWFDSLGGRKSDLNKKTLKELFQIGITNPASHSIRSHCEERVYVPIGVAEAKNIENESFRAILHRHLLHDVLCKKLPTKVLAFNRLLPLHDRVQPCDNNVDEEWLQCRTIPPELINFSATFSKVLHLQSVDAYCHYLLKNDEFLKPEFLVKSGAFDRIQSPAHETCPHSQMAKEVLNIDTQSIESSPSFSSIFSKKSALQN